MTDRASDSLAGGIAVVGMAGCVPGAANVEQFWENLKNGVESISVLSDVELEAGVGIENAAEAGYVRARSILRDVEQFDAGFFGINTREAELMDPQHRIFLEKAWEALEDAGYDPHAYQGSIGVYAGCSMNTYLMWSVCGHREVIEKLVPDHQLGSFHTFLGNDKDFLPTRVSYKLDLRGPSISIQTACSTSLVAVVQACSSLLSYQCDLALAGGISISFPQERGYVHVEGGMGSPDGHCRPFDADAQGTVFGGGAGVVALKRVEDALADGDVIHAVIRGAAVNNDGSGKVSYTAPSVDGQANVIATAQALSGVSPDSITFVEAHGTATALGDPIEVAALTQAFRAGTDRTGYCALGSAKSNIGHLESAAGVTGLIKTVLALKHRQIPPTLHFQRPNPKLELEKSPFYVNAELLDWPEGPTPRRAGVSSFGVGGTNAHAVLEEAPPCPPPAPSRSRQLLTLSARSPQALEQAAIRLRMHLERHPELSLADAAYTLHVGRHAFDCRRALVCADSAEAIALLERSEDVGERTQEAPSVVFMFPGQGAQQVGMGQELYESEPTFRATVDRCCDFLQPLLGLDLREVLYPPQGEQVDAANERLKQTWITQPALFVIEYALAQLWMEWGVRPDAMVGHSVGEYVAACLAGVFEPEDALALLADRGRMMQELPPGEMLAVRLPEAELAPLLGESLCLAAVNGPSLCVVAGPSEAVDALRRHLEERGSAARPLHTSHAFHSSMIDPIVDPFTRRVAQVTLRPPQIPYLSGVTGKWITEEEATCPKYWARHFREAVRFSDAAAELLQGLERVFLEVGPGRTLATLVRQQGGKGGGVLTSLPHADETRQELLHILTALGRLWEIGIAVNWSGFHAQETRRRVSLPTYPFERERYWVEPPRPMPQIVPPLDLNSITSLPNETERGAGVTLNGNGTKPGGAAAVPVAPKSSRQDRILGRLKEMLHDLVGLRVGDAESATSFLELGLDSLFLTQASQAFQKEFKVKVTFRQLLDNLSNVQALAAHLDKVTATSLFAEERSAESKEQSAESNSHGSVVSGGHPAVTTDDRPLTTPHAPDLLPLATSTTPDGVGATALERVVAQQLQLMAQQIEALRGDFPVALSSVVAPATAVESAPAATPVPSAVPIAPSRADREMAEFKAFGPYKPITRGQIGGMTPKQQTYLDSLIERYTRHTPESRRHAQTYRAPHADPRVVSGFRAEWKEMVYPIVIERSAGSHLWDIDGNDYVDLLNGFGLTMFGHSPRFVTEAVEAQIRKGVEIGPQTPLAGKTAELICELTGMDRACFCNTGSEAVMAAIRVARTVTARDKIVLFAGAYHGTFDEVLVRANPVDGKLYPAPIAPGIPQSKVENAYVLEYGTQESLEFIREHADELAAVLVETVQSRRPDLQPREFLCEVRRITEASGTALIFDEVVTGFRVHPGGVQALFGIRADMATYGKVIGGGYPIGVLAGRREFMDALDGGMWQYGDASFPEVGVTFHAGTFVRHPLAIAAAHAVLSHLKESGAALQQRLNERAGRFAATLNALFEERQVPTRLRNFGSVMYFRFPGDLRFASLLYFCLRLRGVHILEGFPCFLTTAHTDEELEHVVNAFRESILELQGTGLLPGHGDKGGEPLGGPGMPSLNGHSLAEIVPYSNGKKAIARAPLTEAQREIWLSAQMGEDASCAYNESCTVHLRGDLDVEALRHSIQGLLDRHDALRARFAPTGEYQEFLPKVPIDVPVLDLTDLPPIAREQRIQEIVKDEACRAFDLLEGPLFRARILKVEPQCHQLVFTTHHIACDGWSIGVILKELGAIYSSFTRSTAPLPAPEMQFGDYAQQETDHEEAAEAEAYWLGRFADSVPSLDLPTDRPRPPLKTYSGSMERVTLDGALLRELKRTSAQRGATLFSTLLAAFKLLLHRLSGQGDLVVGVPAAGQAMVGASDLVGHCLNFLPLRSQAQGDPTFVEYVSTIKRLVLDAYEHQNYTYGTLIRKLDLPRDTSRLPLLSVMFNLDPGGMDQPDFAGLGTSVMSNPKSYTNVDLFLNIFPAEDELRLECDYNSDLFDRETVRRWLDHYRTLIEGIIADPERPLSAIPMLSQAERNRLVSEWNRTGSDYPRESCLHQLIEEQVERTPEAIALVSGEHRVTYAELDRRANRLAHHLQSLGVGPEVLVGVCLERTPEMLVTLLAIQKAGGAYLPLDPDFPRERIGFILEDARIPVLITQAALKAELPALGARVVCVDRDAESIAARPDTRLQSASGPGNLAYVIYTSGSTGKPKGVAIDQRALVNFLWGMKREPGLQASDTLVAVTTLSFDIAGLELFLPLLVGARVVLVTREVASDGRALAQVLTAEGATVLQATPATWRLLVEAGWQAGPGFKMLCGGEALPRELAEQLFAGQGELWNMYGPTETTIWSSVRRVERDGGPILLGPPMANTRFYVLDGRGEPAPVGVPGELLIGGDGLARGYLDRPELTGEKFVPDPFSGDPGARCYRTGDLVRWRPNGCVEYLGRLDHQVKVRGFRIELGEIEAALDQLPEVRESAAVARDDESGGKRLVAYVVLRPGTDSAEAVPGLRSELAKRLPEYMVPAAFVVMDTLPRTPNGKVDRKALPMPDWSLATATAEYSEPETGEQHLLAAIWTAVLGIERIGIHDNIFELGADSLLIFQAATRARSAGLEITPRLIFSQPTIAEQCEGMEQGAAPLEPGLPIRRAARRVVSAGSLG